MANMKEKPDFKNGISEDGNLTMSFVKKRRNRLSAFYSRQQWIIFFVFSATHIFSGMCYSLHAPFYPKMANEKGMSATVYGIVFGAFEITNFFACPVYGKNIRRLGVKRLITFGTLVMGICGVLIGFLSWAPPGAIFTSLSFIVRIAEALGQSGFLTASYATVINEFPSKVPTTFSLLETIYAVGILAGPAVGTLSFKFGGFIATYALNGCLLIVTAIATYFFLPNLNKPLQKTGKMLHLFKLPGVAIYYYTIAAGNFGLGFIFALLEPHLRQFNLPATLSAILFMLAGGAYALTAILWGFISEKGVNLKTIVILGGIFVIIGFLILGPAPFIPIEQDFWVLLAAICIHGLGAGALHVASFLGCKEEALLHGFPDNIETFGLVSGVWISGFAFGSFLGPALCGVLYDSIGFRNTSLIVVASHIVVVILMSLYYFYTKRKPVFQNGNVETIESGQQLLKKRNEIELQNSKSNEKYSTVF